MKLANMQHSKCCEGNLLRVQLPLSALQKIRSPPGGGFLLIVDSLLLIVNTGQNCQNCAKNIVFSAPHLTNLYVFHIVNI